MKRHKRQNIGSVSHGTMRSEDLIESFIYELQQQKPLSREHRRLIRDVQKRMRAVERLERLHSEVLTVGDMVESSACVYELVGALECYAPTGFYFGAHPGDGSDYGFWLSEDFIEDFDGLRVSDLASIPTGYCGEVLHVNDHGNVSLYAKSRSSLRQLWAIV
jgi:hypothetical protein